MNSQKECVARLQDFAKNLLDVVGEVHRLETVNEEFYQNNVKKDKEILRLKDETYEMGRIIQTLRANLQNVLDEAISSNNLITLKVSLDLRRDSLKDILR